LPQLRTAGFIGVDIFFVISGYLITQIILSGLHSGSFSLAAFYARRVRRIVPALLVILAASCLLGWLTLFPAELRLLGSSIAWCAPFLANMFFARMGNGYFDQGVQAPPLLHLWSLGVEEQFYFAWPVLMMVVVQRGVTMRALIAVTAVSLAISLWGIWHAPLQYFYLPASRAWELAAGAILAAWRPGKPRPAGAAASLAGTVLIAAIVVFFDAVSSRQPAPHS
jgi:peptidoglycan/LPS O-acetylase OafA/YrhL